VNRLIVNRPIRPSALIRAFASRFARVILAVGIWAAAREAAFSQIDADPAIPYSPEDALPAENKLQVEDIFLLMTSGTLALRDVHADHAIFDEDSRTVITTSVTLILSLPEQKQTITAHADKGRIFLLGRRERMKAQQSEQWQPLTMKQLRELANTPDDRRTFGDIVLEGPVTGHTHDGGEFQTGQVVWSEHLRRLLVPSPFTQFIPLPGGGELKMSGGGFQVDSTLRRWTYHYTDERPFVGSLTPGAPDASASWADSGRGGARTPSR